MTNYMAEVAKMLGVELNEIFEYETIPGVPLKLTETGLVCLGPAKISRDVMNEALVRILTGCTKIKRRPWKPKRDEIYYCVNTTGYVCEEKWYGDVIDTLYYKLGNCHKYKWQAEANRDKWLKFYRSDEVLEV